MAKASYPLKQVLDIKQRRVEEAEKVLKEKLAALEKEKEKLAAREAERDQVLKHKKEKLQQLRSELDHGTTTDKIQQMKAYLKIVEEKLKAEEKKVKDQKQQVELAEKQVEAARHDLNLKRLEVDKLEIHRKDWEKIMKKEQELRDEREHDEIGNIVYFLHQQKIE